MHARETSQETSLESVYIELDPVLEGFEGVFVELSGRGEGYTLIETAAGTGNILLRFSSKDLELVYGMFRELTTTASAQNQDVSTPL